MNQRSYHFPILVIVLALAGCASAPEIPAIPMMSIEPSPVPRKSFDEVGLNNAELSAWFGPVDPGCFSCDGDTGNCTDYQGVEEISFPEWEALFPDARFYLISTKVIQNAETSRYGGMQSNMVIIQQEDRRYYDTNFRQLLDDNQITINDGSRARIAKAYALLALSNYLKGDVTLGDLQTQPTHAGEPYHEYKLTAWTEMYGYQVDFVFDFQSEVVLVRWNTIGAGIGSFIEGEPAEEPLSYSRF